MKHLRFAIIAAILFLLGCSASMQIQSGWYRGIVKIDGQLEDWNGLWQLPEGGKVAIASKNDAENLYLAIKTRDMHIIRKIATQGFKVMIDRKGGQRERYGLIYKGKVPAPITKDGQQKDYQESMFQKTLAASLTGPIGLTSVDQNEDIQPFEFRGSAMSKYLDGEWLCEFKIPLTALKEMPKPGSTLGVGFKTRLAPITPQAFPNPADARKDVLTSEWWVKVKLATEEGG